MLLHRIILAILYLTTVLVVGYLTYTGWSYYTAGEQLEAHHPLHEIYKPTGLIGHGLGIIGSLLMVVMQLYSVRKRFRIAQGWGDIRIWLNYHIWMGVTGPLLVVYHTAFKFGGIVAISFWSMVGVALSGVLGRYIYIQIPRSRTGQQISAGELEQMDAEMMGKLGSLGIGQDTLQILQESTRADDKGGWGSLIKWVAQDIEMPLTMHRIKKALRSEGKVSIDHIRNAMAIIKQKIILRRRIRFLHTAEGLLHYWHYIHKPFAIVMLVIMVIHTFVALLFGYMWIWTKPA
jgi:hypothetical protein